MSDKGALFMQILHKEEGFDVTDLCEKNRATVDNAFIDDTYDIHAEYYRITKMKG